MATHPKRKREPKPHDKLTAGQAQTRRFVEALVGWAQEHDLPPGLAVLGALEFVALSIQQNFGVGADAESLRVSNYLRERVTELNDHST
jgi:hypothetical protein